MRPPLLLYLVLPVALAASACGARSSLSLPGSPGGSAMVPPGASCAPPAPSPTTIFADPQVFIGSLAVDADAIYFTDPHGAPVVTRISKCDGKAQALAGLPDDPADTAMSLAVAGGNVAWIELLGTGGEVLTVPAEPGGQARLLASTSQPLGNSIGLDEAHAYFGDGAVESVSLLGGAPSPLASGWANIAAVDATRVYFWESPPTGTSLASVPKSGGSPTILVPSVTTFFDFAQDDGAIYWLAWNDQGSDSSVMRVPKNGGDAEVVVSGQSSPHGIAVDDVHVYWTVGNMPGAEQAVVRAPKGGGAVETLATGAVVSIGIDARSVYWSTGHALMKLDK